MGELQYNHEKLDTFSLSSELTNGVHSSHGNICYFLCSTRIMKCYEMDLEIDLKTHLGIKAK